MVGRRRQNDAVREVRLICIKRLDRGLGMRAAGGSPLKTSDRELGVWDMPLRLFHWLLVLTIAIAFLSAEEDSSLNQWHEPSE
jgi:hypothetical protein